MMNEVGRRAAVQDTVSRTRSQRRRRDIFLFHIILRPLRKLLHLLVSLQTILLQFTARLKHQNEMRITVLCGSASPTVVHDEEERGHQRHPFLRYFRNLPERLANFPQQPTISILLPAGGARLSYLEDALESIAGQCYAKWEACIACDATGHPAVRRALEHFKERFPAKVRIAWLQKTSRSSAQLQQCLQLATGEYIAFLDHDDRLMPNALAEMVRFINLYKGPDILYSDERLIAQDGTPLPDGAMHKPAFSPAMLLSFHYCAHLAVFKKSLVDGIGGFRDGVDGAEHHDLMLRAVEKAQIPIVHLPLCLYQARVAAALDHPVGGKSPASAAALRVVQEACERRGRPAQVAWEGETGHFRVKFALPTPLPLVSIIIPTKDNLPLIRACLDSIMRCTSYPHYEIIIMDNGSSCPDTLSYFAALPRDRVRVVRDEAPFNFARLNNTGARVARGAYLVLLNNDTTVISPDWLEELLRYAQFSETGAVGGKLLYPDDRIQHAGVFLLDRGIAGHSNRFEPRNTQRNCAHAQTPHEAVGVTAACLMVAREKYWQVSGLDEIYVPNGFGDVDFCLKLRERGYTNIYTPYAELYHWESASRGPEVEMFERYYMLHKWGGHLINDPYLNINFQRVEQFIIDHRYLTVDLDRKMFDHYLAESRQRTPAGGLMGSLPKTPDTSPSGI